MLEVRNRWKEFTINKEKFLSLIQRKFLVSSYIVPLQKLWKNINRINIQNNLKELIVRNRELTKKYFSFYSSFPYKI